MTKGERAAEKRRRKSFPLKRAQTPEENYEHRLRLGIYTPRKISRQISDASYKRGER